MMRINFVGLFLLVNVFYTFKLTEGETNLTAKVIGGEYVSINDYPYAAFITVVRNDGCVNLCGSSILNQYLLLTAAHCFDGGRRQNLWAYAGSADIQKVTVSREVVKTYIHEYYRQEDILHDIALLVLEKRLPLRVNVQRVFIKPHFPSVDEAPKMFLAGWGLINEEEGEQSVWLKALDQTLQSPHVCSGVIGRRHPGMFCAESTDPDARPSLGDSGSGIVTAEHQLMGILSFKPEKHPSLPFYTSIAHFYTWIMNKANKAESEYCWFNVKKRQ